ncbi:MAG TPA: DUF3052 domain-containing protein [Thermoanaerobaculia bacterium]|nr:DUF3052 domain-containing protein [Thermoanaerobaculia bacterium]
MAPAKPTKPANPGTPAQRDTGSGRPLVVKLGLEEGMRGAVLGGPPAYRESLVADSGAELGETLRPELAFIQLFVTERAALQRELPRAMRSLVDRGALWVSWPKRASRVPTDVTEDVVREVALPLGLVDVKVCAVDETWSGLKLVRRLPAKRGRKV